MIGKEWNKAVVFAMMAAVVFSGGTAWAAERATAKEAEAIVKKGIAFIKANGKDKGYAEVNNKHGQFVDRDLYLIVQTFDSKILAHGQNEKLIGLDRIEAKDIDGKEYMRERSVLAKSKTSFWHDYKFTDPMSKKIEPKSAYCERLDEATLVCSGIYKP